MPRYLFEADADDAGSERAMGLTTTRHPEVAVEQQWADHDGCGRDVFVCRAPSPDHIKRWAADARLTIHGLRGVHPGTGGLRSGIATTRSPQEAT